MSHAAGIPSRGRKAVVYAMGCRLNHAEAAKIAGALHALGWETRQSGAPPPPGTEAYILHSCAVTGEAVREAVRRVRAAARAGIPFVAVSGCAASVEGDALRAAGATHVFSRLAPPPVPPVEGAPQEEAIAFAIDNGQRGDSAAPAVYSSVRAPVKIQDGCSFRCSYCIVPQARGAPRSRGLSDILRECEALTERGYREIVLTGVNAAFWRDGPNALPQLVRAVADLPGVLRVRLGSIEPGTHEDEIAAMAAGPHSKVCPFFHLPLQSGSDRILAAMRRHYDSAAFRAAVEAVVAKVPRAGLGTDVMTGFPGETDEDFALTMSLIDSLPLSNFHIFPYSERPGTAAAAMPGAVPVETRRERARTLAALGRRKRAAFAAEFVGKTVEVLVERVSRDGLAAGWTGEYLRASIPGVSPAAVGTLVAAEAAAVSGPDADVLVCEAPPGRAAH